VNFRFRNRVAAPLAALTLFALAAAPRPAFAAGANSVLLTLGDSYAYGFTTGATTPIGFGDQGYVAPFADYLATINGGFRPLVENFAIVGESSVSFTTGTSGPLPATPPYVPGLIDAPARAPFYNSNYPNATTSQASVALAAINAAHLAGKSVDNITLQLGGNDTVGLFLQPTFLVLPLNQQLAILSAQTAALQTNYATLLATLTTVAPEAKIFAIGYPDSLAGLGPFNPLGDLSRQLTLSNNAVIRGVAHAFGARYVDIYTPFHNRELELTNIGNGENPPNPHPNAAGYSVIGNELRLTAAAPEPASFALFALLLPVALVAVRRRA
jgi:lysophospholipase L1-like esterase